jgi:hypothetical protein
MGHQHYSTTQRYLHHKPRPRDARVLEEAFELERSLQIEAQSVHLEGWGGMSGRPPGRSARVTREYPPAAGVYGQTFVART